MTGTVIFWIIMGVSILALTMVWIKKQQRRDIPKDTPPRHHKYFRP